MPESLAWIDSHAHLQDELFSADLQLVLDRSSANGIVRILLPSSSYDDSQTALSLARQDRRLVCAVGCHPHEAETFDRQSRQDWLDLVLSGRPEPIVAIGEIGLDYHYDFAPRPLQQEVFRRQLDLAYELDLPVIIHEREAVADCLTILEACWQHGRLRSVPGVFHCYSGSPETAAILLKMGFYLGFDGPITFKNARKSLDVLAACRHDRVLLETDSPYLTPVPLRGQRNEPANIPLIGSKVAEIWQLTTDEVAAQTTANAIRLFGLDSLDSL
jgi:TatD DNase family protein